MAHGAFQTRGRAGGGGEAKPPRPAIEIPHGHHGPSQNLIHTMGPEGLAKFRRRMPGSPAWQNAAGNDRKWILSMCCEEPEIWCATNVPRGVVRLNTADETGGGGGDASETMLIAFPPRVGSFPSISPQALGEKQAPQGGFPPYRFQFFPFSNFRIRIKKEHSTSLRSVPFNMIEE